MNILYAGFEGRNNTSKILLDKLNCSNKLYLKNDKNFSCMQVENLIKDNLYDIVLFFGQKPIIKNKLSIEKFAKNKGEFIKSNLDVNKLALFLTKNNINNYVSKNSGTSYCNNIYYNTLKYVKTNNLKTKVVFIHLPYLKNIDNLQNLINTLTLK